jgi:hypothetical protein
MEDWLSHKFIKLRDMLLSAKIVFQRLHNVFVQSRALSDQRINSLSFDFPRNSVDQEGILDGVELTKHWILLEFFGVQDIHVCVNQKIQ